jgi:HlyD family secretion protein
VRARTERDVARALIENQRAQVALSRAELDRVQGLVKNKTLTEQIRDESQHHFAVAQAAFGVAEAKLKAAEAEVQVAGARTQIAQKELEEVNAWLGYATLRSPFRGVATGRNVDLGDLVKNSESNDRNGRPLFTVAQLDKVRMRVAVPERDVPWVKVGKKAEFRANSIPARVFPGTITRSACRVDPSSRTMLVEVDFANPDGTLVPGMYGEATLILDDRPDRLVLPTRAVHHDNAGKGSVLVAAADGKVCRVDVLTGQDDGKNIEILQGLTGQEQIITVQPAGLAPGQLVRCTPEK